MKKKLETVLGATTRLYSHKKNNFNQNVIEKPTPNELNEKDPNDWKHDYIVANGINFHYVTQGNGPLLILLHGFPESWYSWRAQIPFLAEKFKVVAIDLRGYNLTDKPQKIDDYKMEKLVEDIRDLILAFGQKKATIVAHDWGGAVAWNFAMKEPEMLEKLVIMNCPHPVCMINALKSSTQLLHSWYMLFFQLPVIPEFFMALNDYKWFTNRLKNTYEKPDTAFNEEDRAHLKESIKQPGASTAMVNYYRSILRNPSEIKANTIETTTLLIWGEKDRFLIKKTIDEIEKFVPGIKIKYLPEASHWVHRDEPEQVNQALKEFLF